METKTIDNYDIEMAKYIWAIIKTQPMQKKCRSPFSFVFISFCVQITIHEHEMEILFVFT